MKTKSGKMLPKTATEIGNGGVYLQRVRCGKANCRCARGEKHLAHYFFYRRHGKLVKIYIRKSDVQAITALAEQASAERAARRRAGSEANALLKRLRELAGENERLLKNILGI